MCISVNFVTAFESLPCIRTVAKYAYRFRGHCAQKQEKRAKLKVSEELEWELEQLRVIIEAHASC